MKRYRIMKIKEIIQNQVIETQEELAAALKKEGIVVTQATVSRDIKELILMKSKMSCPRTTQPCCFSRQSQRLTAA